MEGDEFCCEGTFLYFWLEQFDFIKIEESDNFAYLTSF